MSTITYTISGIIAPITRATTASGAVLGMDGGGYFGPVGGSLAGAPYSVTWIATDCECLGTPNFGPMANFYPNPDPIADVTLTINGHTYDFGGLSWYGSFHLNGGGQQAGFLDGSSIYTLGGVGGGHDMGEFEIVNGATFNTQVTSGVFIFAGVPVPVGGAGWSGLAVAIIVFLLLRRLSPVPLSSTLRC